MFHDWRIYEYYKARHIDVGVFDKSNIPIAQHNMKLYTMLRTEVNMSDFIDFVHGAELIMHNASFDQSFIDNELSLAGSDYKLEEICKITDTLKIARELHPGENNSLDGLCSRYSVNELDRSFHGALLDAEILSQVYSKIFQTNHLISEV